MLNPRLWTLFDRPALQPERARQRDTGVDRARSTCQTIAHHVMLHSGSIGPICVVAYIDPGNWTTDLLAGSQFGYKLLFIVLLAGLGAVVLQVLSCKLGCVTGLDLAAHCRLLLHDHPRYPRLVRYVFLYPLYLLSELAIISTDLAELLGSAIGLVLIFPKLSLPVAVLLTATDVIFILAVGDPSKGHGRSMRFFEFIIIALVIVVFVCFVILIVKVNPYWPQVFEGYLPSHTLTQPSALYASVGILGATVMPHALYLCSHLATRDRVNSRAVAARLALPNPSSLIPFDPHAVLKKLLKTLFSTRRVERGEEGRVDTWTPHGERENNSVAFIKAHYKHSLWDIILSLLGFAVTINSAILILAGAVFFFGTGSTPNNRPAGLFDAHDLIRDLIGKPAAFIFAVALVCSGQSASITATLAGQIVSEGFIQWSVSPFLRRLTTRLLGLIPAMAVALVVGRPGINTLLIISQVVLSIVLPFVMFPLVWLTSSCAVMRVSRTSECVCDERAIVAECVTSEKKGEASNIRSSSLDCSDDGGFCEKMEKETEVDMTQDSELANSSGSDKGDGRAAGVDATAASTSLAGDVKSEYVDYSNGWPMTILAYTIWLVILVANGYVLVTLAID